jgi:hypothetical protein
MANRLAESRIIFGHARKFAASSRRQQVPSGDIGTIVIAERVSPLRDSIAHMERRPWVDTHG